MKLVVLIPAYNCAKTLPELVSRLALPGANDSIIIVDDCSDDDTLAVARRLPRVIAERNDKRRGYGGTSRRLYELAVANGADITVSIHGDLAHRPEDLPRVAAPLAAGTCDIALGSRLLYLMQAARRRSWWHLLAPEARQNMPLIRLAGHVGLTWFQNLCIGSDLHSFHEGMRGCTREVIAWILRHDFPAWYDYDAVLLIEAHRRRFRIFEAPIPPSYDLVTASSAPPLRYGLRIAGHAWRSRRAFRKMIAGAGKFGGDPLP